MFWSLTPRALYWEFAAENARRRNQANRDARLAWLMVQMWAVTKSKHRLPNLQSYLIRSREEEQAAERDAAVEAEVQPAAAKGNRMRTALTMLSEKYGIPLRLVPGKKK